MTGEAERIERDTNCRNCGAALSGPFCSACGQYADLGRLTVAGVFGPAISSVLSLESRLTQTLAGLTCNPGRVAAEYVAGRRLRYVHPFRYYLLVVAGVALIWGFSGNDPLSASQPLVTLTSGDDSQEVNAFLARWLANTLILALPILAGLLRLFFPRSGRNFLEGYVLALYATAHAHALSLMVLLIQPLAPEVLDSVRRAVPVVWLAWGVVVFYRAPWVWGTLRAAVALVLYLGISTLLLMGGLFAYNFFADL